MACNDASTPHCSVLPEIAWVLSFSPQPACVVPDHKGMAVTCLIFIDGGPLNVCNGTFSSSGRLVCIGIVTPDCLNQEPCTQS